MNSDVEVVLRGIKAAGMKPGPDFKIILRDAVDAQDAGEFRDKDGALIWLAIHYLAARR